MRPDASPSSDIEATIAYLKAEAARYAVIAMAHIERAQILAAGTDRIPASLVRAQRFEACAQEAVSLAEKHFTWANTLAATRANSAMRPGDLALLPATFLRRCSDEDYPGEGLFRLSTGETVRAPLAPPPSAADPAQGVA